MKSGRPDEGGLRRMGDALAHRGPDDLGVHIAGPLGLLQTRLSIIDVEGGHQPIADGPLSLVANVSGDVLPKRGLLSQMVFRLPWAAKAAAEELYLPADYLAPFRSPWKPEKSMALLARSSALTGAGQAAPRRAPETPGRNEPCHCGSGKKYKRCHGE